MVVECSICNKTYANKNSLGSHKRQYHKSITRDKDNVPKRNDEHDLLGQKEDNDVFSTIDQYSNDGSESIEDNDEEMDDNKEDKYLSNVEDEEKEENEDEEKPSSEEEEDGDKSSNGDREIEEHSSDGESVEMNDLAKNNDQFSDSDSAAHKQFWLSKRLINIMKAIEKYLEDAQEIKNLQLLDSYELKKDFSMNYQIFSLIIT